MNAREFADAIGGKLGGRVWPQRTWKCEDCPAKGTAPTVGEASLALYHHRQEEHTSEV